MGGKVLCLRSSATQSSFFSLSVWQASVIDYLLRPFACSLRGPVSPGAMIGVEVPKSGIPEPLIVRAIQSTAIVEPYGSLTNGARMDSTGAERSLIHHLISSLLSSPWEQIWGLLWQHGFDPSSFRELELPSED